MNVRYTLEELSDLAVNETGFCVGVYWTSVTGSRVPEGMVSARCRLAYVLFSGWAPAYRYHGLLARRRADRLPRSHIRLVEVNHAGQRLVGVAVVAVMSPDRDHAEGVERAPAMHRQPGYHRFFQAQAPRTSQSPAWWNHELGDTFDDTPEAQEPQPGREYVERQADEETERVLDRLEAEFDEKLWWYGAPGRRTKYPPALGSVRELFAYARKQELDRIEPTTAETANVKKLRALIAELRDQGSPALDGIAGRVEACITIGERRGYPLIEPLRQR